MGVSALLAAFAGTAAADPADSSAGGQATAAAATAVPHAHGAIGTIFGTGLDEDGAPVGMITLSIAGDDKEVAAYCIDLGQDLKPGEPYQEGNWDSANPGSDMSHILWVLNHSYPVVGPAEVLEAAQASLPDDDRPSEIVYVATQAAVWHFSDKFVLDETRKSKFSEEEFDALVAVYKYLTGSQNTGQSEPAPTLSITPSSLTGQVGKPIGPFTVHTTADSIALSSPQGAKIVGRDGTPVSMVGNGQQFSVVLDKAGKATVEATGSATIPAGRVFVYQKAADEGQKVVLAQPSTVNVSATVTVEATEAAGPAPSPTTPSLSPSPSPSSSQLASTGASPWPKVGIAVALLAVGAGLVLLARKRRSTA